MKVISIKQPWAELIVAGVKRIENRTWLPSRDKLAPGEVIAIHSSKQEDIGAWSHIHKMVDQDKMPSTSAPLGCIVGLAVYCGVDNTTIGNDPFAVGPQCWRLELGCRTKPYTIRGRLGIWEIDNQVAYQIRCDADTSKQLGWHVGVLGRDLILSEPLLSSFGVSL